MRRRSNDPNRELGRGNAAAIARGIFGIPRRTERADVGPTRPTGSDRHVALWLALRQPNLIVATFADESGKLWADVGRLGLGVWNAADAEWCVPFSVRNFDRLTAVAGDAVSVGPALAEHVSVQRASRQAMDAGQLPDSIESAKTELRRRSDEMMRAPAALRPRGGDAAMLVCANCKRSRLHVYQLARRAGQPSFWRCQSCGSDQRAHLH